MARYPLPVFVFPRTDPRLSWVIKFFTRQLFGSSFSHETPPVLMILSNKISVSTGGQIIVRNNIKYSGGRYGLICLLCSGVDRVGKPTVYYEA